jgi:hypothetical protein
MVLSEPSDVGMRLDAHHAPETNGRMAVCRRCGSRTDAPAGSHHLPSSHQLTRSDGWLAAQVHLTLIEGARASRPAPISPTRA